MIHLFSTKSRCRSPRLATAAIAGALLAAGGTFTVSPAAMADGPPAASPGAVQAGLGVRPIRAEIVILVDISLSMSKEYNDLYSGILDELPAILNTLARQAPQDTVAVIEFSAAARQIYDGSPNVSAMARLPRDATEVGSDIGAAFQQAIATFNRDVPAKGIQAGAVLLLSDGELYAPGDPDYGSYGAPAWNQLRTAMMGLPVQVTGYGLQLPTANTYADGLPTALGQVFGTPAKVARNTTDLTSELETPRQKLLDSEVASAAAQDRGKGVRVTWGGLPGTDESGPLNLTSAGHMDVEVTLTATTRRVPLYLTGLSVGSPGLSGTMSGTLPASDLMLAPGQSVTLPVHLTWRPRRSGVSFTGAPQTVRGRLVLAGRVSSTYTQTIKYGFNDTSFSTGGLTGASSTQFTATTLVFWNLSFILMILAIILLLLGVIAFFRFRIRLGGTFTLTSVDDFSGMIPLSRWRWRRSVSTDDVIGIPGRMTMRGQLFGKGMKIGLHLENRPASEVELAPGGRTMIAGIDIVHDTNSVRPHTGSAGWR